jgi:5-methylcytosine-specific restriction endonuclease McrA
MSQRSLCKGCRQPLPDAVRLACRYYCDSECKKAGRGSKSVVADGTCRICKAAIDPRSNYRNFCSVECRGKWDYKTGQLKAIADLERFTRQCIQCGNDYFSKASGAKYCGTACLKAKRQAGKRIPLLFCARCGDMFKQEHGLQKYCSTTCCNGQRKKNYRMRQRARTQHLPGMTGRKAWPMHELAERDGFKCGICHETVDMSLYRSKTYNPMSPTVDHIIPLSKFGPNEWSNIQLAHHICNSRKTDAVPPKRGRKLKYQQLSIVDE